MFEKEYRFKGSHAQKVSKMISTFVATEKDLRMFNSMIDILINAPLVGFLYNRKAPLDKSDGDAHIFADQMRNHHDELMFVYRLIVLCDDTFESDAQKRLDLAFRSELDEDENDESIANFNDYVRGGIDILYEKVMENSNNSDDFIKNLNEFLTDFQSTFNEKIDLEDLEKKYGKF